MLLEQLSALLSSWGMASAHLTLWTTVIASSLSLLLGAAVYLALTRVVIPVVLRFVEYTEVKWDDIVFNPPLLRVVAELALVLVLRATLIPSLVCYPTLCGLVTVVYRVAIVCVIIHLVNRFLVALFELLASGSTGRVTSLKGILQMLQVISVCVGIIIVISILADKDPIAIITGLGAAATVLMLVFKDSIMGVVAGVQLTLNDMLRPGDWITVPARNINGTVMEVGLTTVKVQNFDKTIVTVPPYSLVSESFQNWRGMTDSGGRRINRSLTIDINTVGFCEPALLADMAAEEWAAGLDTASPQVNLTLFRRYLEHYLSTLPQLNDGADMVCMVRELEPTPYGLPLDLYFFTTLTAWKPYEHFQADVMDHILASVSRFGLRVYQAPSGLDLRRL